VKMATKKYKYYGLRTCDKDMKSYNNFIWPKKGRATAPDWKQTQECGNGLHAILNGIGDGSLLSWDKDANWLVVGTDSDIIELDGKVKSEWWDVLFVGDRKDATDKIMKLAGITSGVVGAIVCAGDRGTATAGYMGTATAGYRGTATAGDRGTATAGDRGTATAGYMGTATAGYMGIIIIKWLDSDRYRITVGYIGENGLLPNRRYVLNDTHELVLQAATK